MSGEKEIVESLGWYSIRELVHDWKVANSGQGNLSFVWANEAQEALVAALEVLEESDET